MFGLVLIRKTLILEESGYSAAVIGGFMRTAWIMKIYMKVVAGYILFAEYCSSCLQMFMKIETY